MLTNNQYRVELSALQTAVASCNGTLVIGPTGKISMQAEHQIRCLEGSDEIAEYLQQIRPREYS